MQQQSADLDDLEHKPLSEWTQEDFASLICAKCQFYKQEDEQLECGAFQALRELLKSEVITIDEVRKSQIG